MVLVDLGVLGACGVAASRCSVAFGGDENLLKSIITAPPCEKLPITAL